VDSVGHTVYYERLFEFMKLKLPVNTRIMLQRMKRKREYDRDYQAQPRQKRKRANFKFAKMKDGLKKQMADKAIGLNYETGLCLGPTNEGMEQGPSRGTKKGVILCKFCQGSSHKTRRSKDCKYFGWPNELVEAEMVRINILKSTSEAVGLATVDETSGVQSEGT
jgi:hypothetical protein